MDSNNELFNKNRIKRQLLSFFADKAKVEWNETVNRVEARNGSGRNKLRTYKPFKTNYKRENYFQIILPRNHRSAYAKFRSGVAPLRLELGGMNILKKETECALIVARKSKQKNMF